MPNFDFCNNRLKRLNKVWMDLMGIKAYAMVVLTTVFWVLMRFCNLLMFC